MSTTELIAEFAKLTPPERDQVWEAFCILEEQSLLAAPTSTEEEKAILDAEMSDYERNPQPGAPWTEVEARIRAKL
jgi:putative addiction module component (TIGR02574 family)